MNIRFIYKLMLMLFRYKQKRISLFKGQKWTPLSLPYTWSWLLVVPLWARYVLNGVGSWGVKQLLSLPHWFQYL